MTNDLDKWCPDEFLCAILLGSVYCLQMKTCLKNYYGMHTISFNFQFYYISLFVLHLEESLLTLAMVPSNEELRLEEIGLKENASLDMTMPSEATTYKNIGKSQKRK